MNIGEERNRQVFNKLNNTSIVKLLILSFLMERNHYGNEIIDKVEKELNYNWKPSPGMLYPLLRNMEENLFIDGWWEEPDKKTIRHYKITDIGISHYERIKTIYKPQLEQSLGIINSIMNTVYK